MLAHRMMGSSGGGGGAVGPVDCTFTDSAVSTANSTAYTFSSQDFGEAAADRYIVVTAGSGATAPRVLSSVTIGGVAATIVIAVGSVNTSAGIAIAKVPTGTTGDVVVTFDNACTRAGIGVYRLLNLKSATATATANDETSSSNALAASLTIPSDGCGIGYACACAYGSIAARTWVWTNLTENFDTTLESDQSHSGAMSSTAGTATRTATASGTINSGNEALVLAAWR